MSIYLENLNASACQYQLYVQERLTKICEPIFKIGIKHFAYDILFENGSYFNISTHQDYIIKHCTSIKSSGSLLLKLYPTILKNSHLILPQLDRGEDEVIDLWDQMNIRQHFSIYKNRNTECLYAYSFFTDEYNPLFYDICLNNFQMIEEFCDYFDVKASHLTGCNYKDKLAYFDNKIKIYTQHHENACIQKTEPFLQGSFTEKIVLKTREKDVILSKREMECLKFLSLGKTMKEIGKLLGLSPRSVEFYLQNIKIKSGLNRGELIAHFVNSFSYRNFDSPNRGVHSSSVLGGNVKGDIGGVVG